MAFEMRESSSKVLLRAMMIEMPVLAAGFLAFFSTGNGVWLAVAAMVGSAIMLSAVFKVKKLRERDNASR
ncbi:MAG: hypothetical protein L3J02_06395 [Henriciella sp.]|nr:hypothetical protein [Henriciella sp.]